MRAVNLLPRDVSTQGRRMPPLPAFAACVGVVLVTAAIAVLFLSASSKVAGERSALQAAQAELAAVPAPAAQPPVATQLPQERQSRVTALATALGQRVAWDRVLREISQVVPGDVWLTMLTAKAPALSPSGAAAGAPPTGFEVTGCTYSQDSVARFLARLDLVPDLSQMTLGQSSTNAPGSSGGSGGSSTCPSGMFTFMLVGNVRTGGAS